MHRDNFSLVALVFMLLLIVASVVGSVSCDARAGRLGGQCARKCAPQDSKLTSYWDGWDCVCVDKGVQLNRRSQ